jgi:hypothetical protein
MDINIDALLQIQNSVSNRHQNEHFLTVNAERLRREDLDLKNRREQLNTEIELQIRRETCSQKTKEFLQRAILPFGITLDDGLKYLNVSIENG